MGFQRLFFTGGEPFILDDIYDMLAYAAAQAETMVLTNASLLRGPRLDRLAALRRERLVVQVSFDGARPEHHDPYRGAGSWERTVEDSGSCWRVASVCAWPPPSAATGRTSRSCTPFAAP